MGFALEIGPLRLEGGKGEFYTYFLCLVLIFSLHFVWRVLWDGVWREVWMKGVDEGTDGCMDRWMYLVFALYSSLLFIIRFFVLLFHMIGTWHRIAPAHEIRI